MNKLVGGGLLYKIPILEFQGEVGRSYGTANRHNTTPYLVLFE